MKIIFYKNQIIYKKQSNLIELKRKPTSLIKDKKIENVDKDKFQQTTQRKNKKEDYC